MTEEIKDDRRGAGFPPPLPPAPLYRGRGQGRTSPDGQKEDPLAFPEDVFCLYFPLVGGRFTVEGASYPVDEKEVFAAWPGQVAAFDAQGESGKVPFLWLALGGEGAPRFFSQMGFTREEPVVRVVENRMLLQSLSEIGEEAGGKDGEVSPEGYRQLSIFYQILALLLTQKEARLARPPKVSTYVDMAADLLRRSYQEGVKVADIAKEIGVSRNYLSTIFKREMDMSPQEYLMRYRMEQAATLLRESSDPIKVVAGKVGYSDSLSFSKAFRNRFGVSPSEYRAGKN